MKRILRLVMGIVLVASGAACQDAGETVTENPAPRLISIVPLTVWNGCTAIISGTGFSTVAEENIVNIDGQVVAVTSSTANRLVLTMPDHEDGVVSVTVSVKGEDADTQLEATYAQLPELLPKVTGMMPAKGFVGDEITIYGENFSSVLSENSVTFDGVEAVVNSVSSTMLKVTAPEHPKGNVDVQVISAGKVMQVPSQFRYMTLSIVSNAPTAGAEGHEVTINGDGFSSVLEENVVLVNGVRATVKSASETSMIVIMPENPHGEYDFTITVGNRTVTGGVFKYGGYWRLENQLIGIGNNPQDIILASDGNFWFTTRGGIMGVWKFNPSDKTRTEIAVSQNSSAKYDADLVNTYPWAGDFDSKGVLWFAGKGAGKLLSCTSEGVVTNHVISELTMSNPMKVLVDSDDNLYVLCRAASSTIHKIKDGQKLHTYTLPAAGSNGYEMMCFSADKKKIFTFPNNAGRIMQIDLQTGTITQVAGTGTPHSSAVNYTDGVEGNPMEATFGLVEGAISDADGVIYFTDATGKTIRTFTPDPSGDYSKGSIMTIAGNPYDTNVINYPNGIALASDGKTLYFTDNGGKICKIYYK